MNPQMWEAIYQSLLLFWRLPALVIWAIWFKKQETSVPAGAPEAAHQLHGAVLR